MIRVPGRVRASAVVLTLFVASCGAGGGDGSGGGGFGAGTAESCMTCHNASPNNDYAGPGIENPHPFPGADNLRCTQCHGGNPLGDTKELAHIPPPPEIGDRDFQDNNRTAWFNRLTLTGIDKLPSYEVDGVIHSPIDYLQFVNPGDLRVVNSGRSCGLCHSNHAEVVGASLLATEAGVLDGAMYAAGIDNPVLESVGLHADTAVGSGFRTVSDVGADTSKLGVVSRLLEFPVFSARNDPSPDAIHNNPDYVAANLPADIDPVTGQVVSGSRLANLYHEQVAFTCGDCHLGSAGANNRTGDYRSSGCTACHMPYSLGGRSGSRDPNVNKLEPLDPDDIDDPERPHVRAHRIVSVHKDLPNGHTVEGMDDLTCAGCHQGSNRTVMQFWGIRLDQNQDVRRNRQYPEQPDSYVNTSNDVRLFDPTLGNNEFNGRNRNQYLAFEDYDGDGRDDTPPDVHHDAGMGCIDCHGSHDLHGGDVNTPGSKEILSRMEQAVAIRCEDCHGTLAAPAATVAGVTYDGVAATVGVDSEGHLMRHVTRDADGNYFLKSRLTGNLHYLSQVRDVVVDTGRINPITGEAVYSEKASYAMGRADGDPNTGLGPQQNGGVTAGFSHMDNMDCASCHSSWTNNCIGCHLVGEYNGGNNFSNITGERIVFREKFAEFVYQTPVPFQLGVSSKNKISNIAPNTETFFSYEDFNDDTSQVFAFSNRHGQGNNTGVAAHPSLSHNMMMPHSIRGKVDNANEGPRYCVACHLTDQGMADFGVQYTAFKDAMAIDDYASLDFNLLREHIGQNPGNQLNSPLWVHMVAGLGSGLFLFDEDGCPVNPLDDDDQRFGCNGVAPASIPFDPARVRFNLDRIVLPNGISTGSNNHPRVITGADLRDGASDPELAGPMGSLLVNRLTDPISGIVLDSWMDANGYNGGQASDYLPNNDPPD